MANCLIPYLKNNRYKVESQSQPGKYYDVCFLEDCSCTCSYHAKWHADCKHIIAVQMPVMRAEPLKPVDFIISKPAPKRANEKCGSVNCKFCEPRPRKSGGASDRYKCVECGRRLACRPGFLGRHYDDAAISGAIGDATDSKSLGAAARSVPKYSQSKRVPVRSTVLRRMQHAKRTTAKIPENIPIRVGGKWNADETCFPADKGGRYMSSVVDAESRFMLANETHPETEKLQTYDATDMFRRAGRIASSTPQAWFFVDLYRHVQAGRPYSKGGTRRAHKIYAERFCARVQECDSEVRKIPQKRPKARARTHRVSTEPPHQQQPL